MERKILAIIFSVILAFAVIFCSELFVLADSAITIENKSQNCDLRYSQCVGSKAIENHTEKIKQETNLPENFCSDKNINIEFLKFGSCKKISLYEYIIMVVMSEMPYTYNSEALKAQAVAARTYALKLMEENSRHDGFALCNDPGHCSAVLDKDDYVSKYGEKEYESAYLAVEKAVRETDGFVLMYDEQLCCAVYHSNSNGKTENSYNLWGTYTPYLVSVSTSEIPTEQSVKINREVFYKTLGIKSGKFNVIYNDSGRVSEIQFPTQNISAKRLRQLFGLKSCDFIVSFAQDEIIFDVYGYGHGIGMSQRGANNMAVNGSKFDEILKHYYSGVSIEKYKSHQY